MAGTIARKGFSINQFTLKAVAFTICLSLACSVSIWSAFAIANRNIFSFIVGWAIATLLSIYTLTAIRGLFVWMRGSLPLTKDPEGKYITTEDGRIVEYFVYGSNNVDAKVCVLLHGSGGTGKFFNQYICQEQALVELNVRAISPSYPGHGGSDVDMFRRITDWPITDLEPILTKEGVEKFYVVGASYGTAHGMAVASSFPQRVLGLGLNAPYLPEAICRDENYWTDADMILRETQLQNPAILLPILGTLFHADVFIESGLLSYAEGKKLAVECPDLMKVLVKDAHRCFMRGVNGQVFEMLNAETTQTWQDPRTIVTKNIAVWYADDDSLVRPEYGSWLATYLKCEDRDLSVKSDKVGLGHFTWMVPPSCETAAMVRTLLANTS